MPRINAYKQAVRGGGNQYSYGVTLWDDDWHRMGEYQAYEVLAARDCNNFRYGRPQYFR